MSKSILTFTVYGTAIPQGSKRAFSMKTKGGKNITRVVNDNPNLDRWRQQVAETALEKWGNVPLDRCDAVRLSLAFFRPRPASHYGTGRNAGTLKASAPAFPTGRPDTVKLARAVEDALTGIVWRDDAQVCRHWLTKHWGERHCVVVQIYILDETEG